jgi:hypothetical protein
MCSGLLPRLACKVGSAQSARSPSIMTKSLAKLSLIVIGLYLSGTSQAQGVRVQGVGTFSCGQYLELRGAGSAAQNSVVASWVWGYMAGFNMEVRQPTTRDSPDEPSTLAFIDKYCRDNPLDSVLIATNTLIQQLGGRRNPR